MSCVGPLGPEIDVPADQNPSEAALHRPQMVRADRNTSLAAQNFHRAQTLGHGPSTSFLSRQLFGDTSFIAAFRSSATFSAVNL